MGAVGLGAGEEGMWTRYRGFEREKKRPWELRNLTASKREMGTKELEGREERRVKVSELFVHPDLENESNAKKPVLSQKLCTLTRSRSFNPS